MTVPPSRKIELEVDDHDGDTILSFRVPDGKDLVELSLSPEAFKTFVDVLVAHQNGDMLGCYNLNATLYVYEGAEGVHG